MILIHGFNDYNFNTELNDKLLQEGYNVFSITFRNYGQNIKSFDTCFYTDGVFQRNKPKSPYFKSNPTILSYFIEINLTFEFIKKILPSQGNDISITAHSLGGLISTIYCSEGKYQNKISKLILNSPFYYLEKDFILSVGIKYISSIITEIKPTTLFKKGKPPALVQGKFVFKPEMQKVIDEGIIIDPVDKIKNGIPWIFNEGPKYFSFGATIDIEQGRIRKTKLKIQENRMKILIFSSEEDSHMPNETKYIECIDKMFENCTFVKPNESLSKYLDENKYIYHVRKNKIASHNVFISQKNIRELYYNDYLNFLKYHQ